MIDRTTRLIIGTLALVLAITVTAPAQGSYGTGKLPNRPPKVRRELKTVVMVESVNADDLSFKGVDEITGDKLTYRASKRTTVHAEKGLVGSFFGKKELEFSDLKKGLRIEIKYNELLPTSVTEIKILKPKE